jgi:photosystem II stability/assembly factor-like uncharacterized protein
MRKLFALVVLGVLIHGLAFSQSKKGAAAKKADEPKFKAIWEPVPFNKDIKLNAISCTGPEACYVAGDKGTILFTPEEDLDEILFIDSKHGWVKSERDKLMGTTDGVAWSALGNPPATAKNVWFVSPQVGFVADNHDSTSRSLLNRTVDGGKTWKRSDPCSVDAVIGGLARKLGCLVQHIQFVSATTGFMGGGAPVSMGSSVAMFAKSTDGGASWNYTIIPETKHSVEKVIFWSEKDGLVLLASGQTYWTADAGATWTGSANPPPWRSYYASGEGKIIVGVWVNQSQIGYSFNGGRSFSTRAVNLPARPYAVTFFDARHGYLVGDHGMVYRYRIVPADYNVAGMIGAMAP